jgi:hypothetical protein
MPPPFNSYKFFGNPFFTETATVGTASLPVFVKERPAPDDAGTLQPKAGRWADISILARDLSAAPAIHSLIVVGADSWRVTAVAPQGDVYKCLCICEERKR